MAYGRLHSLQGDCVPRLLAAGTIDEGRTAFLALTDAGVSQRELMRRCNPKTDDHITTPQVLWLLL